MVDPLVVRATRSRRPIRGAHDQPAQEDVARSASSERPHEASGAWVELATGEQRGHAGMLVECLERLRPVRQNREIARFGEAYREPLQRGGRVDADRATG